MRALNWRGTDADDIIQRRDRCGRYHSAEGCETLSVRFRSDHSYSFQYRMVLFSEDFDLTLSAFSCFSLSTASSSSSLDESSELESLSASSSWSSAFSSLISVEEEEPIPDDVVTSASVAS
jgi:hypothetical protein